MSNSERRETDWNYFAHQLMDSVKWVLGVVVAAVVVVVVVAAAVVVTVVEVIAVIVVD